jgi:hypothetical protein
LIEKYLSRISAEICEYCGKKQYLKSWNETITKGEWIDKKTK